MSNRQQRRKVSRAMEHFNFLVAAFRKDAFFDEKKLDWNDPTKELFKRLKFNWINYAVKNGFSKVVNNFEFEIKIMKTDLILVEKYKIKEFNKLQILKLLERGMTELHVAQMIGDNYGKPKKS